MEIEEGRCSFAECGFLVVNPRDVGIRSKYLIQEVLNLYTKELPAMNYAANTGKQSSFLERCVSSGKFCTLILSQKCSQDSNEVIAAITYQIIPTDTYYAEIPLAAVSSSCQHKGVGRILYTELRKRLQDIGISTILCWGDKESEGFWHKQGFVSIAEVDAKGRARSRRLPIRADIRRALCFPGGSTLMVTHLNDNLYDAGVYSIKLCLNAAKKSSTATDEFYSLAGTGKALSPVSTNRHGQENLHLELNVGESVSAKMGAQQISSTYERNTKRRVWETTSSLNSKRVKAAHVSDLSCSDSVMVSNKKDINDSLSYGVSDGLEKSILSMNSKSVNVSMATDGSASSEARRKYFTIMLMDIAEGPKKAYLTKIVEDLGGAVTADGRLCTHLLTGKFRRTVNFCTALCSGAWILSPNWLKESSREGRFVDELPFLLKDEEYFMKYRVDLEDAVLRARRNPHALFKGYNICLTTHVYPNYPSIKRLSDIVKSAGGDVNVGLGKISEKSRAIFVACEDDMEEALLAVKSGVQTFNSEWLMTCIMKQEIDLNAPQFVESLWDIPSSVP